MTLRALLVGGFAAVGLGGGYMAFTPEPVPVAGCWWWTAAQVGDIGIPFTGCVRGYLGSGGTIAEAPDAQAFRLSLVLEETLMVRAGGQLVGPDYCHFEIREPVLFQAQLVFDDGRTLLRITRCR